MTKGLSNTLVKVSKSPVPSDPRARMYPYAYSMLTTDEDGNPVYVHLYTSYSTLLNNVTRSFPGDKYENGKFVIDYSFNEFEEEEEEPKRKQKVRA